MKKSEITKAMLFGQTIYSFYCYGYRWWGGIANEILDRIGKSYTEYGRAFNEALKAYNIFLEDGDKAKIEPHILNLYEKERRLRMAIYKSGVLGNAYFTSSEPLKSKGRKVGLLEILKRLNEDFKAVA